MSYAALLSLAQTTGEIIFDQDRYPNISTNKKQEIRSIYEPFIFLREFLEDSPEKANTLNGRIRDLAYEAEDMIESLMLEESQPHWWTVLITKSKLRRQMRKIREETESITRDVMMVMKNKDQVQPADASSAAGSPSRLSPTSKIEYDMVGLNEDLVKIKSRLCGESSNLQVISIVGMGGIGKTTLAKSAYNDPLTMQHFDIRAWLTVTQDYSADALLSCLLASVEFSYKETSERSSEREVLVGEKVFKILKRRRYLIVVDDIWNTKVWDDIQSVLPDDGNGSRVMLTTRLTDVAAYPDPYSPLHEMRLMDEDQSWDLLQKKVFADQRCVPELEGIGKEIARSCKGLPLAVVVVAGLLSVASMNPTAWREIAENVNAVAMRGGEFESILLLSYTHLPHHLRSCFLYMGMFPEDCEVRVSKLVKLWAAEGFLRSGNGFGSFEQEGEECLKSLVKRSLVLVTKRKPDGRIKSCSLHDLMRDLCIRKAHEEKFLVNFGSRYVVNSIPKKTRGKHHRVSVNPSTLPRLSKVYGLTMRSIFCSGRVSVANLVKSFRLLRVLDAGEAYLTSLPHELFELYYLVYLAIYYLGRVPAVVSKLQNLQTLILHSRNEWRLFRAQAICLPQEIWRMPQLRHLIFYGRLPEPQGRTPPCILGNLQTLSIVSQVVCTETILRMIPNIKKLELHCSSCPSHLVHLHQLEDLKLRSYFTYETWHGDSLSFPKTVRKLTLSRLPLPWEEMSVVGSLPNLRVLKLTDQACKGSTWETSDGEFPELEFLLIGNSSLENWMSESSSHFPMLKWVVPRFK